MHIIGDQTAVSSGDWELDGLKKPWCWKATTPKCSPRYTRPRAEERSNSRLARSSSSRMAPPKTKPNTSANRSFCKPPSAFSSSTATLISSSRGKRTCWAGSWSARSSSAATGSSPGPEDDLLIVTRNVQLNKQSISTPERVRFGWGPHFGSGQEMEIKLLPGKSAAGGMDVGGIASFELRHIERLHLELGPEGDKLNGRKGQTNSPERREGRCRQIGPDPWAAKTPVDIACSGPFRFDVARRVATFHDNVRVVKTNPRPGRCRDPSSHKWTCPLFRPPIRSPATCSTLWFIERYRRRRARLAGQDRQDGRLARPDARAA